MSIRFFHVHNLPPVRSVIASDELEARAVARAWLTPPGHNRALALLRAYYPEDGRQTWKDATRDLDPCGDRVTGLKDFGFAFEVAASFLPGQAMGYQKTFGAFDLEHAELIARRLSRVEGVQGVAIFERLVNGALQVWKQGERAAFFSASRARLNP